MLYLRSLLILLLALILLGAGDITGVDTGGVGAGDHGAPINLTSCEDLIVAYWDLDETGTNTRVADYGTCTDGGSSDCDLTAETGTSNKTGIRGNAVDTNFSTEYLSCANETCDELMFAGEDFTVLGWVEMATIFGSFWMVDAFASSIGYEMKGIIFFDSDNGTGGIQGSTLTYTDVFLGATNAFTFWSMSWDDTEDDIQGCVSNSTGNTDWECYTQTSATGPVADSGSDFIVAKANGDAQGAVDELAIVKGVVTEEWQCFICSCWLDGTNCNLAGLGYSDVGNNSTDCGNCTLPNYTEAQECPAF